MKWNQLVYHEMVRRKTKLVTSLLAITLGIAVIVAIQTVTYYSELAINKELDMLGMNILILPPEATVEDYYRADIQDSLLPEEYVTLLATSDIEGLDNVSPKLSVPVSVAGIPFTLTGILPKEEFQSKAAWKGAGIFSRPKSCGNVQDLFGLCKEPPQETLVRKRVIETLDENEALVGSDVANKLKLKEGDSVTVMDRPFTISAILPVTGTIDDSRLFTHLHTVQEMTNREAEIQAIEVVGCCDEIFKGLVTKLQRLLPSTKIVTVSQIVDTQVKTNGIMRKISLLFIVIIIAIGGASIANDMYGNVYERRKEIGTLLALGATSKQIRRIFFKKALMLGIFGGVIGFFFGTILSLFLGPLIANVPTLPLPQLLIYSLILSCLITLSASYLPARRATLVDPQEILKEE